MGVRQEYLDAVIADFADAKRDQLVKQIAHCWKRIDDLTALRHKAIREYQNIAWPSEGNSDGN